MDERRFELRWRHHQSTVVAAVASLYRDAALVDVTLACEDQRTYQAHKLVLSACSSYFQSLFTRYHTHHHPIIFLKDVSGAECETLLAFMYRGEVSVAHDQFERIIRVANSLQIRGLAEMETSRPPSPTCGDHQRSPASPPPSPSLLTSTKGNSPANEPHVSPPTPSSSDRLPSNPPSRHPPSDPTLPLPPSHHSSSEPTPPHALLRNHPSLAALAASSASHLGHPPPLPHPSSHLSPYNPYSSPMGPHHPPPLPVTTSSSRSSAYHDHLSSGLFSACSDDRKRPHPQDLDDRKPQLGLPNPYVPHLQVKRDLGGTNSWDGGGSSGAPSDLDSPLSSEPPPPPPPRNPYFHNILSFIGGAPPVDHHSPGDPPPFGLQWNGMFKGMHPLGLPPPMGSDKRTFSIVDPILRGCETRLHKCQYCNRKFKRKDHLKTHVRIHTGERPYKCKICNRGFIQSQQVKIHMKVHVREDSSGLGSASGLCGPGGLGGLGGGGAGGGAPHSSMPPIFPPYSDHNSRSASHHSSVDSHTDLDPHLSMNLDSDNECSSEMADADYDHRQDLTSSAERSPPRPSTNASASMVTSNASSSYSPASSGSTNNGTSGNGGNLNSSAVVTNNSHGNLSSGAYATSGSFSNSAPKRPKMSPPSPESPTILSSSSPPVGLNNSSSSQQPAGLSHSSGVSQDDRSAVSLKESFHLGSNSLKK